MLPRCMPLVLLILAGLTLPARAQVQLEWKLKKGDQFFLETASTFKQTLKTQNNKELKQDVKQTAVLGFTVVDQIPSGFVLKETVHDLKVALGDAAPVSDARVQGAVVTLTVTPKMEVLKLEGYEKVLDKVAGDDAAVRKTLQAILGEDTLKKSAREVLSFVPEREVKEGETWERSAEIPFGPFGTVKQTNTYKLEGKEALGDKKAPIKVCKVSFSTAVDFKVNKPDPSLPYHVISGELKAEDAGGTLYFDDAAGRLVKSESKMTLRGRMILSAGGSNADAEVMQEQSSRITLLNKKPIAP